MATPTGCYLERAKILFVLLVILLLEANVYVAALSAANATPRLLIVPTIAVILLKLKY